MNKNTLTLLVVLLVGAPLHLRAQPAELNESINEVVIQVPKAGLFTIELETTLYKPDGPGPFPIAVINHGKASGDPRFQSRYRPALAARYFMQRGYAVVVPMRQGFSKSGGSYIGGGCNVESNGRVQASDVKALLDHVTAQPWADKQRIVVLGQSHGGWTTLAFGPQNYPGVRALINFAGGLRQETCTGWEGGLARAAADYGKETSLPSLWFYGDNDSYFNTDTFQAMFARYNAAGGKAKLVAFGKFGSDAHSMFGSRAGAPIWQPEVTRLLAAVGLPSEPQAEFSKYRISGLTPIPPKTSFAPLEDETRLPHVKESGRNGYKIYLAKLVPRAFAIGPSGAWAWADGGEDPLRRALDNCKRFAKADCKLYSVDDDVVWTEGM
ncbi:MAG: alpha/beta hydrolase [Pseudomonadota bacterium]|uniref:dienelactone hydrolase family protein n=1 Tax=Polaromonas sp. TaxID=1869339 RepID=UPI0017C5D28D|nr:CocE/NonD family hydrolase [Polaromonas sp.]MBA3592553.1 alpha/beta hydrolase [Polaromonas sp.]MDQ3271358.1 alpha/beta hydrolase [Pseudomonadota bacterium]